jgi:hypothetical protein
MAYTVTDETRYYSTNETAVLPSGSRPVLAREDGTKWVQDSDGQLFQFEGVFNEAEMTDHRNGEVFTHAKFKRDYEAKWGPNGEFTRPNSE